mmetsp:Transcript_30002/g.96794  ORF Transcript_30002/g.96794 Transcript_30002/m.96794 type:complete len:231 (+) Transcript_30002:257-949(+)
MGSCQASPRLYGRLSRACQSTSKHSGALLGLPRPPQTACITRSIRPLERRQRPSTALFFTGCKAATACSWAWKATQILNSSRQRRASRMLAMLIRGASFPTPNDHHPELVVTRSPSSPRAAAHDACSSFMACPLSLPPSLLASDASAVACSLYHQRMQGHAFSSRRGSPLLVPEKHGLPISLGSLFSHVWSLLYRLRALSVSILTHAHVPCLLLLHARCGAGVRSMFVFR